MALTIALPFLPSVRASRRASSTPCSSLILAAYFLGFRRSEIAFSPVRTVGCNATIPMLCTANPAGKCSTFPTRIVTDGRRRCRASCARRCGYSLFRKGIRGGYLFHSCYHLVAERVQVESLHGFEILQYAKLKRLEHPFAIHEKRSNGFVSRPTACRTVSKP
jgi:hypothetical protein